MRLGFVGFFFNVLWVFRLVGWLVGFFLYLQDTQLTADLSPFSTPPSISLKRILCKTGTSKAQFFCLKMGYEVIQGFALSALMLLFK